MYTLKRQLTKALKLQKLYNDYNSKNKILQKEAINKCINVWGKFMAYYLLENNNDAEDFIWSLDSDNLQLFLDKF